MFLDLMDILRAPGTSLQREISLPPTALDDVDFVEPIVGEVKAANARRNIVVSGHARSAVQMRCARCLRDFAQPVDLDLEAVAPVSFFRSVPNAVMQNATSRGEDEAEDGDEIDDETAAIFDAHTVDVLELLRQAAVLQWPIQPLCSRECSGLPEADRYEATGDERWAALQSLALAREELPGEGSPSGDELPDEDASMGREPRATE
jgi:uncharacterized protein